MDGKQLKNSILQWAIQGKLVEQLPKEGSAKDLYEKILAEKQTLTKAGKLKKEKTLPPISPEDIPFEIPKEWKWCRIGDIFTLQAGKNIASSEIYDSASKEHPYPCYGGNGRRGYVSAYNRTGHFCIIGRQGALCGNVNFADGTFYATEHAVVVDVYSNVDVSWSGIFLSALNLNRYATATAQPGLAVANINKVLIPLPPIGEQKRIVAKLEKLLPLIDEFSAAQEQLDKLNKELPGALKKSILQQAIQGKLVPQNPKDEPAQKLLERIASSRHSEQSEESSKRSKKISKNPTSHIYCENGTWYEQIGNAEPKDISDEIPFDIPASWAWTRMGNIGSWGAGATPAKGNSAFYKDGVIPWLVTGELNNSIVTETKTKVSKIALEKCSLRLCKPGDVLIAMYGATIGKLAIAGIELTTNQACCACSLYYDYNKYLFYFLMASKSDLIKRGEGGAQPNISKEKLVNYLIPLPPLAEQKRIVAKIEQLFKVL